jgi:carboxymethylenebutenolidase
MMIETPDGAFTAYRALPRTVPAPLIVVLQELFGVNADMRATCDELAARGFVSICPDLFWRQQPDIELDILSPADWEKGLALYAQFDRDLGVQDVVATIAAASGLSETSSRVGLLGYCLGGLLTFMTAARAQVDAAVAFHGAETEKYLGEAPSITAPMIFHLAGNDEFMPADAQAAIASAMASHDNVRVFTYPGCRHAFSRHGGAHFDAEAAALARGRTWAFFKATLVDRAQAPFVQLA